MPALCCVADVGPRNWPRRRNGLRVRVPGVLRRSNRYWNGSTSCATDVAAMGCDTDNPSCSRAQRLRVLMGAGGYQALEDTCDKFTQRQLRALGCQRDRDGDYAAPSDSTFYRVLSKLDTHRFDRIVGDWLLEQEISVVARLAVDGKTLRGSARTRR